MGGFFHFIDIKLQENKALNQIQVFLHKMIKKIC